jgi:hypothetical protein
VYAFQLDLQSTTSFYQGYLDDQQKYQAFPSAPFCVCGCNFSYNAEYPKLIEREVSLEGRFVKLKPENVEVHWVHGTSDHLRCWSYDSWSITGYIECGNSVRRGGGRSPAKASTQHVLSAVLMIPVASFRTS